jgi:hypothetical protein
MLCWSVVFVNSVCQRISFTKRKEPRGDIIPNVKNVCTNEENKTQISLIIFTNGRKTIKIKLLDITKNGGKTIPNLGRKFGNDTIIQIRQNKNESENGKSNPVRRDLTPLNSGMPAVSIMAISVSIAVPPR